MTRSSGVGEGEREKGRGERKGEDGERDAKGEARREEQVRFMYSLACI